MAELDNILDCVVYCVGRKGAFAVGKAGDRFDKFETCGSSSRLTPSLRLICADKPLTNITEKEKVEISDEIAEFGIAADAAHPREGDLAGAR
jgi:hypothetical protein